MANMLDLTSLNSVGNATNLFTSIKLKSDTFDGSTPLREFFAQFDLITYVNRWEGRIKTAILISSEKKSAQR